jgi:hypothetical protein
MHQAKADTVADEIDNQRGVGIAIAVTAHQRHGRTELFKLLKNTRRANISEMPNFIDAFRDFGGTFGGKWLCVSANTRIRSGLDGIECHPEQSKKPCKQ